MNLAEWAELSGLRPKASIPRPPIGGSGRAGCRYPHSGWLGSSWWGTSPARIGRPPAELRSVPVCPRLTRRPTSTPRWRGSPPWPPPTGARLKVVTEIGSALNGKQRKFLKLLSDPTVTTIVVEHQDRFARFGAEHVAGALDAGNRRMVILDDAEVDDDLVQDMTELMTSLCARLYGRRSERTGRPRPSR